MRTSRCLFVLTCTLCTLGFVSSAWAGETSIPILGAKGLIMPSGMIAKIEGGKFTVKDDTSKLFIIAEIDRRERIDKVVLMQFKVGKRVKVENGKISTLPDPLPKPLEPKGTLPDPLPRPATGK